MKVFISWLLAIIILSLGGIGFAYLVSSRPQPEPITAVERAWTVAVRQVRIEKLTPEIMLYGRVDSPAIARLTAAITADVISPITALEGQTVSKGDTLIRLDDREAALVVRQREAEVADIQAQIESENMRHQNNLQAVKREESLLELVRTQVRRTRQLTKTLVGSQSQFDQARREEEHQVLALENRRFSVREHAARSARLKAQLARALALLDRAKLDLERTQITAPFNGRLSRVHVSPGNRVRAGDPLIDIYDNTRVEIRAQIPLHYLPRIRAALDISIKLKARATVDDRHITAILERLSTRIERGSVGADGLFNVTRGGAGLALGRVIEVVVELPPENNVVALPAPALYGANTIYTVENDRLRALTVERVGITHSSDGNDRVLVRSPKLKPGSMIVINQLPNAINGLRVRPLTR